MLHPISPTKPLFLRQLENDNVALFYAPSTGILDETSLAVNITSTVDGSAGWVPALLLDDNATNTGSPSTLPANTVTEFNLSSTDLGSFGQVNAYVGYIARIAGSINETRAVTASAGSNPERVTVSPAFSGAPLGTDTYECLRRALKPGLFQQVCQ